MREAAPRIPHLRPRESGDVVAELNRLLTCTKEIPEYANEYVIAKKTSQNLTTWPARVQTVMANSKDDISQYLTITSSKGDCILLPGTLYSILSFMLSWLAAISSIHTEDLPDAMNALLSRDRKILLRTIGDCMSHAKQMWMYAMMTVEWSPYIIAVITTYWDIVGVLDPTIWNDIMGEDTPTWMKLSCNPCMLHIALIVALSADQLAIAHSVRWIHKPCQGYVGK